MGLRAGLSLGFAGRPDPGDTAVADGAGLDDRGRRVGREDAAAREDEVGGKRHARIQAARCEAAAPAGVRSSGSTVRHSGIAIGQRGLKRHPGGIAIGFGVSPLRICGSVVVRGSRFGTTEMSAFVYGCFGSDTTSRAGPSSTIRLGTCRDPVGDSGRLREVVRDHEDPALSRSSSRERKMPAGRVRESRQARTRRGASGRERDCRTRRDALGAESSCGSAAGKLRRVRPARVRASRNRASRSSAPMARVHAQRLLDVSRTRAGVDDVGPGR